MRIDYIVCPDNITNKLAVKHHLTVREARQVLLNQPRIRFAEHGDTAGEDVYAAFAKPLPDAMWSCFLCISPRRRLLS